MNQQIDRRRIVIFLAFAYGIAWSIAVLIYWTGGLQNSAPIGQSNIPWVLALLAAYMAAPALAHLLTRAVTREGWRDVHLRTHFNTGWKYWLIAWVAPAAMTLLGLAIFMLLFPQYYDPSMATVMAYIRKATPPGQAVPQLSPWMVFGLQTLQAVLIAPIINSVLTLGEEFGWRAYLQYKFLPLGGRKAMLWMGLIWGVWHAPLIAMGHNYGLNYPGAPWLGIVGMIWFCLLLGTFLGWASLRAGSVWPAVIGHSAINGIAGIGIFLVKGEPNQLLGPLPVGIIGSLGFLLFAAWIFWQPDALQLEAQEQPL